MISTLLLFFFLPSGHASAMSAAPQESQQQRSPAEFLKSVLYRPVIVKLNSGVVYQGLSPSSPLVFPPFLSDADADAGVVPFSSRAAPLQASWCPSTAA